MTSNAVNSNSSLSGSTAAAVIAPLPAQAPKPNGILLRGSQPASSISLLTDIDDLADEGLKRLADTSSEVAGAQFQASLDKTLEAQAPISKIKFQYGKQIHIQKKELAERISAFAALVQLSKICGVGKENAEKIIEPDYLKLLKLANEAVIGVNKETVWSLFSKEYANDISFFSKIIAALFYWCIYQTSLISNTVATYLNDFIDPIIEDLSAPNSSTRAKLFPTLLNAINQFLEADYAALKVYLQNEKEALPNKEKDKDSYRRNAVAEHIGSIAGLCESLVENILKSSHSSVPILRKPQQIPILGVLFELIEWVINKIIRIVVQHTLPKILESIAGNVKSATAAHNIPFKLGIANFFIKVLKDLKQDLKKKEEAAKNDSANGKKEPIAPKNQRPLLGTEEKLPAVVKNILRALRVKGIDAEDLRKEIGLITQGVPFDKGRLLNRTGEVANFVFNVDIEKKIVEAISRGGQDLLEAIDQWIRSGKLFHTLLDLVTTPFSSQIKEQTALESEYKAQLRGLTSIAKDVFPKFIGNLVNDLTSEYFLGEQSKDTINNQEWFFKIRKKIAEHTFTKLGVLCQDMSAKMPAAKQDPLNSQGNTREEIAQFLRIMQAFANETKMQMQVKENYKHDAALESVTAPFYQKAKDLQERMIAMQMLQDNYPLFANIENELNELSNVLQADIPDVQSLIDLQQKFSSFHDQLEKQKEKSDLNSLEDSIKNSIECAKSLASAKTVIDAINALEKLLVSTCEGQKNAPHYKKIPQHYLPDIKKQLQFLPKEAQKGFESLIQDGSSLQKNMPTIAKHLEDRRNEYTLIYKLNNDRLAQIKKKLKETIELQTQKYEQSKEETHQKMTSYLATVSKGVTELQTEMQKATLPPPTTELNTPATTKTLGAVVGGLAGAAVAIPSVSLPLAALGAGLHYGKNLGWGMTAAAAAAAAVSFFSLGTAPLVAGAAAFGGAAAGYWASQTAPVNKVIKKNIPPLAQDNISPVVNDIFFKAYEYTLDPIVVEGLLTRGMKLFIESKKT
jgi:hypothetical protein